MRKADTCLAIIQTRGERELPIDDLYRQLFNPDFYLQSYGKIARNRGAMTAGATPETADGMSLEKIHAMIEALRFERFRWTPVRRVLRTGEGRPPRWVAVHTWSDKLLQEVIRRILEAYYEPQFSDHSHGFRQGRGCHSALREIYYHWRGTCWFIEADIRRCFECIDRGVLLSILRERIVDNRFLRLIEGFLSAGYLADWRYHSTHSGTPEGGVLSPILANIYLDRLDRFVDGILGPKYNRGARRKPNQEYSKLLKRASYLKCSGRGDEVGDLRKQMQRLPVYVLNDPDYRRLKYVRYADDFLLGFVGPLHEAEEIRGEVETFLRDALRLELSEEKVRITHARSEAARFLGYGVTIGHDDLKRTGSGRRNVNGLVSLRVPRDVIAAKSVPYRRHGIPVHRPELLQKSALDIVEEYQSAYRGLVNFYRMAHNLRDVRRLRGVMQRSLTKTLAAKFKISVREVYRRYRTQIRNDEGVLRSVLEIRVGREGRPPLVARWGGISLRWGIATTLEDRLAPFRSINGTELVQRLLADTCEFCGSREQIEVHHVRALKDLMRKGRSERPLWARLMAARRRKTLVLCRQCHVDLHAGRLQRSSGIFDTGEPDDAKVSRPVRWGVDGKGLRERDLAGGLPDETVNAFGVQPTPSAFAAGQYTFLETPASGWTTLTERR
jgi:group II intron reverse transcriptase/maturase